MTSGTSNALSRVFALTPSRAYAVGQAGIVLAWLATGAGAEMRRALGTAVFYGMLGVTFFGLLFTPVFYTSIRGFTEKFFKRKAAVVPAHSHPVEGNHP